MKIHTVKSEQPGSTSSLIKLGKARTHTRASNIDTHPEMAGDRTQRNGG